MKKIITALIILSTGMLTAQNLSEAVRYSFLNQNSTARVSGVAGAFGAMGGDIGVIPINPAGLGDFRKSELLFTPTMHSIETTALINGTDTPITTDLNSNLGLASIGVVFSGSPRGERFQTSNLAITINKRDTYRQRYAYEGMTRGSITTRFAEVANGNPPESLDEFEGGLAFDTGAIYDFDNDNFYDTDFKPTTVVRKGQEVVKYGRMNEINLAWGAKLKDNINVGLGIGIPIVGYEEIKVYQEVDEEEDYIPDFNSLSYTENLITSGVGINLRGGVQGLVADIIRVGVSVQSPTWMTLTDDFDASLTYSYTNPSTQQVQSFTSDSPSGRFKYSLTTPWKATGSVGAIIKSESLKGFVNLDVEYLDYTTTLFDFGKFDGSDVDVERGQEVNDQIFGELNNAVNIRLGGEVAYNKLRGRAGLALVTSPYAIQSDKDVAFSVGFGCRFDSVYFDLGWSQRRQTEGYLPYVVIENDDNQVVTLDQKVSNIDLTVGFKFGS